MTRTPESAAQLDDAIDAIIRKAGGPLPHDDDSLVATARLLRRALPRLHPSFSFEEHLAARLAAARRMDVAPASAAMAAPAPIRPDIEIEPPVDTVDAAASERRRRNLVAGGAIASGVSLALPIAGAAIVAWRRSRSSGGLF